MISVSDLSKLRNFFGGYFHQDWDLEADDPDDVILYHIRESRDTPEELRALGQMILDYMEGMDDAELESRLYRELSCEYYPVSDGTSARVWLHKVASMLMEGENPG